MHDLLKRVLNPYILLARYLPALLSALPLFVIWYFVSKNAHLKGIASLILSIKLPYVKELAFSWVFLHFYSLVIREISKHFQSKYFTGATARGFPTTYLMLYSDNTLSDSYKNRYRQLILRRFDFELLNKDDEETNIAEAKKRLNEATDLVRVKIQDSYLVLKHNIWFGSLRNLIGGSVLSIFFCISGILLGEVLIENSKILILLSTVLFVLYSLLFLFRRTILVNNAEAYARQLFAEFIGSESGI